MNINRSIHMYKYPMSHYKVMYLCVILQVYPH